MNIKEHLKKQSKILTSLRLNAGITLMNLAKKLKIEPTRLQRIESGVYEMKTTELRKLHKYYNSNIYAALWEDALNE